MKTVRDGVILEQILDPLGIRDLIVPLKNDEFPKLEFWQNWKMFILKIVRERIEQILEPLGMLQS